MERGDIMQKLAQCCVKLGEWGEGLVKEMREDLKLYRNQMRRYRARRDVVGLKLYGEARWNFLWLL